NREWIMEKFPNAGPVLLGALDQANKIAEYYGWARMGFDAAHYLKGRLGPALERWRADRGALGQELTSSQRKALESIDAELQILERDISKTEAEAADEAIQLVERKDPSVVESGNPGERHAKIGEHEVVEVKDATGAIHCEVRSD